jgi:hypothetical protein
MIREIGRTYPSSCNHKRISWSEYLVEESSWSPKYLSLEETYLDRLIVDQVFVYLPLEVVARYLGFQRHVYHLRRNLRFGVSYLLVPETLDPRKS